MTADALTSFTTRADAVAFAASETGLPDASLIMADEIYYIKDTGANEIQDMPNWLPFGDVYPDHYAQNLVPGTTDMGSAAQSALHYSRVIHLKGASYNITSSASNLLVTKAGGNVIRGAGQDVSILEGTGTNASSAFLIYQTGPTEIYDCTLQISNPVAAPNARHIKFTTSGLKCVRVKFDGMTTVTAGVANQTSYGISCDAAGTQNDLYIEDCVFTRLFYPFVKFNSSTSSQDNLKFIGNTFDGNFHTDLNLNSPTGAMTNVVIMGNTFRNHQGIASGLTTPCIYVALASVTDCTITGNVFEGQILSCLHFEYACRRLTVTGNKAYCTFQNSGGFCTMSGNDTTSSIVDAPMDIAITGNVAENIGTAATTVGVWCYNNAYIGALHLTGINITGNVMKSFIYGYYIDNESNAGIDVSSNIARLCYTGYWLPRSSVVASNNASQSCIYAVRSKGAVFYGHKFVNCTNIAYIGAGGSENTSIINGKWAFREFVAPAGSSTRLTLFPLTTEGRLHGFLNITTSSASNPDASVARYEITWDGTTFSNSIKFAYAPGSVSLSLDATGGTLDVVFTQAAGSILTAAAGAVVLDGMVSLKS